MTLSYILVIALCLFLFLFSSSLFRKKFNRHSHNQRKAKDILKKLQSFDNAGSIINYLRKIDPFVFEELLLIAFENKGYKAIRNKRYTGDGGIDGKLVAPDGSLILVQAKRYQRHINPNHIEEFSMIIQNHKKAVKGYFVHTGKTGAKSYQHLGKTKNITLYSGDKLIKLVNIQHYNLSNNGN